MQIQSPEFNHGEEIPEKYTCDGEDTNPPLEISDAPENAKSLALIVDDPDAPGGVWTHWVLWNMEPDTEEIGEGEVPFGAVEGITSAKMRGYHGPCPPSGKHRYFFKLFALDTPLEIAKDASKEALLGAMERHVIAKTELMGTYARKE